MSAAVGKVAIVPALVVPAGFAVIPLGTSGLAGYLRAASIDAVYSVGDAAQVTTPEVTQIAIAGRLLWTSLTVAQVIAMIVAVK
jgi:hypothetical protein